MLTIDQTRATLAIMGTAFSRAITEDDVVTWHNVFAGEDPSQVGDAARHYIRNEEWWPTPAAFRKAIREARGEQTALAGPPAGTLCDGSGWLLAGTDDMTRPCPTCCPAVTAIFGSDQAFARWRRGDKLSVCLGYTTDEFEDRFPGRPACSGHVPEEPIVSPSVGKQIALRAYTQDCAARGVEPNLKFFNDCLGIKA